MKPRLISAGLLLALVVVVGCGGGDGTTGVPQSAVANLSIVGTPPTDLLINTTTPLVVRATTAAGAPVAGTSIAFAASLGSFTQTNVVTGADGIASTTWNSGTGIGVPSVLAVSVNGISVAYAPTVSRSITGRWSGQLGTFNMYFTITRHDVPITPGIAGAGSTTGFTGAQNWPIFGSCSGTNVSLSFGGPGGTVGFAGTLSPEGSVITGVLDGAGFNRVPTQFLKQ